MAPTPYIEPDLLKDKSVRKQHIYLPDNPVEDYDAANKDYVDDSVVGSADKKAKVSVDDTTAGYLNGKLTAGTGITLTEGSGGGDETLAIACTVTDTDKKVSVSSDDTTPGYLNGKLTAGANISLTEGSGGGNETLAIAATGLVADHGALTGLADDDHPQYTQKATLTAKGDLYTASGAGVPIRVGIGADGSILRVGTDTPAWTTLTIPTTIAIHSILAANASNVLSAVTAGAATLTILEHSAAGVIAWVAPTGSGSPVYSTSPTLVTPILGTPTSGALTNCTFPTLNQNTSGSSATCTGLAGSATILATARAINGVNFDGSAAITVPVNNADDVATNATMYLLWTATAGGNYAAKVSTTKLYFNPSTGLLTATGFGGPLTGNVTGNVSGSSGSCTGNASTVTTNANLTGPITSVGNATSIASQTGTGTKFVVDSSPTIVTPTVASFLNANHTHAAAGATGGTVHHGDTTGLADDDHTIYTKKSTLTAKGSIYGATAASTPGELTLGTDGKLLVAASGQATGLNWTGAIDLTDDSSIAAGKKIMLEGAGSDSYLIYNTTTKKVELYVDGVLVNSWGNNGLKMLMDGTTSIKDLITPPSTAFTMTGGVSNEWTTAANLTNNNFRTLLSAQAPVIAQQTVNLLTYAGDGSTFENGAIGGWNDWSANCTFANVATQYWHGAKSLAITVTATGVVTHAEKPITALVGNVQCTLSGRFKTTAGKKVYIRLNGDVTGATASATMTATGGWDNVAVTKTFAGDTVRQAWLEQEETTAVAGDVCYWDAFQLETGAVQTPYCVDVNDDAVTRTACTMSIPTATIGLTAGNMSFAFAVNTPWVGNDGVAHWLLQIGNYGAADTVTVWKSAGNNLVLYVFDHAGAVKARQRAIDGTSWAAGTHIVIATITPAGVLKLYLDGSEAGMSDAGGGTGILSAMGTTLYLGTDNAPANPVNGAILCAIWGRVLSAAEITAISAWTLWTSATTCGPAIGSTYFDDVNDRFYCFTSAGWKYAALT